MHEKRFVDISLKINIC